MATTKRRATFHLSEDVLRAVRGRAARTNARDSDVVEQALRVYLGFEVLDRVWSRTGLNEDEAVKLAVSETHALRRERRGARRP